MGMDYVPRNDVEGYHLNWSGHAYIARLLDALEADLTDWDGSNDGKLIREQSALAWAALLRDALAKGRIRERVVVSPSSASGAKTIPDVEGARPVVDGSLTFALDEMDAFFAARWLADREPRTPTEPPPGRIGDVIPIDEKMREWIASFASFLEGCGGAEQW